MARHHITELPPGYIIARIQGRQYPMILFYSAQGAPSAHSFLLKIDQTPISYSKRVYAVSFLESFHAGRAPWAMVDGQEDAPKQSPGSEEDRRHFLDSVEGNAEYTVQVEYIATPTASNY